VLVILPKPERMRDPQYLEFVRSLPCLIPGCTLRHCDPHRVVSRPRGGGNDQVVPLCRRHHREAHALGRVKFQRVYGLSFPEAIARVHDWYTGRAKMPTDG